MRLIGTIISILAVGGLALGQEVDLRVDPLVPGGERRLPTIDDLLDIESTDTPIAPEDSLIDLPIEDAPTTDPIELAIEGMHTAAQRLSVSDSGIQTQRVQEQVLRRLDTIIAQARRNRRNQQQQSARQQDRGSQQQEGQQQSQPNAQSTSPAQQTGSRGQVDSDQQGDEPLQEQFEEWGNLPPRIRDALRQGLSESFSSLYEQLTQRYYQRLAEEAP